MSNEANGLDTLRHLFVLLIGLGMRESSGRHCEGRDRSADNVSAETAEAGLFQQSWNSSTCSTEILKLADQYAEGLNEHPPEQCALATFREHVSCSSADWTDYGDSDDAGRDFQALCKRCPQFAVEAAAIGLRYLRKHWGPIGRKEVEIVAAADDLLRGVEELIAPASA
jgi:hypothetical protein